ncbi:MAG: hypothetical protein AMXMBFR4_28020 [Candidatus Hydrogenedentota bacterium]
MNVLGRRSRNSSPKSVDPDLVAKALAKAICDGDFVNFRLLFQPFSPARSDSSERFEDPKYAYLLPDEEVEGNRAFRDALSRVREERVWSHVQRELQAKRPAQLPSELLLPLADEALRQGKYSMAAQAYELMRVRDRIQDEFFRQADEALDVGDIRKAVRGYLVATGLDYNYAAFPEPLPTVPDFQTRALMLHGDYPDKPEDCIALQPPDVFLRTALTYLLLDARAAARLEPRPVETRLAVLAELVKQRDPEWREFVRRYREACNRMRDFENRIQHALEQRASGEPSLAQEIDNMLGQDPRAIPACLLGRTIEDGEWWQYLKELAFEHPAAILFVSRQMVGDVEIIVPRYRGDSPIPTQLGLLAGPAATGPLEGS